MKVLLIRPPAFHVPMGVGTGRKRGPLREMKLPMGLPLGLLSIAAVLEQRGIDVRIYDALYDMDLDEETCRREIDYEGFLMGASWEKVQEKISNDKPDVVGIGNQFSEYVDCAVKVAEIAKQVDRNILTVVGGPHATAFPRTFFEKTDRIDVVAQGEGEFLLPEIIERFRGGKGFEGLKGVAYRKGGEVIINARREFIENLDDLPLPAYHLIDMERYFLFERLGLKCRGKFSYPGSERYVSMITSRGCPYRCIFCEIHLYMGRKWRFHSPGYVLNHLRHLIEKYQVRHVHFEDDNLTLDLERFTQIVDGIIENNLNITWDTPNGVRADRLNRELIIKAKGSGCVFLNLGIESADPEVSEQIVKKKLDLNKVIEIARICKQVKLDLRGFYLVGFPGETKKQIKNTLAFAKQLWRKYGMIPFLNNVHPTVGTDLYELCSEKGYLKKSINPGHVDMIETADFDEKYLEDEIRRFLTVNNRTIGLFHFLKTLFFHPVIACRLMRKCISILFSHQGGSKKARAFLNEAIIYQRAILRKEFQGFFNL